MALIAPSRSDPSARVMEKSAAVVVGAKLGVELGSSQGMPHAAGHSSLSTIPSLLSDSHRLVGKIATHPQLRLLLPISKTVSGSSMHSNVGFADGWGDTVGIMEMVGVLEGSRDGNLLGTSDGKLVGVALGVLVGEDVGAKL